MAVDGARPARWLLVLLFGALYFAAGKLGLALAFVHASASPVWPPTGVAIAALVVVGVRFWPVFAIGAWLINWSNGTPLAPSIIIGLGNGLEGLVGAFVVLRWGQGEHVFDRATTIAWFVGGATLAASLSATVGVRTLVAFGLAPAADAAAIWVTWWLGDLGGAMVVVPVLLLLARTWRAGTWSRFLASRTLVLMVSIAVAGIVFAPMMPAASHPWLLLLLMVPVITAIVAPGADGHAVPVFIMGVVAVWATVGRSGPLFIGGENASLLMLQVFLIFLAMSAMILSAGRLAMRQADAAGAGAGRRALRLTPVIIALLPLMLAAGLATGPVQGQQEASEQARFDAHIEAVTKAWQGVVANHEDRLLALSAFYAGSNDVDADEFVTFTSKLNWTMVPGVLAVEFAREVPDAHIEAYEQRIRAGERPSPALAANFTVHPAVTVPMHYVVEYIEPPGANDAAFGLDLAGDALRAEAVFKTLATGQPTATATVTLVQDGTPGILILAPAQAPGTSGVVLTVHRISDLMAAAVSDLEGTTAMPTFHILDDQGRTVAATGGVARAGRLPTVAVPIQIADRTWTAHISAPDGLTSTTERATPWLSAILGGSLSVAFAGIVYAYDGSRRRAHTIALSMVDTERQAEGDRVRAAHLEEMNRFQARFINLAAHELRTPMVPLRAQLAIMTRLVGDQVAPSLEVMHRNLDRLARLVDDLLAASRAGSSQIQVATSEISPHGLAHGAVEEYASVAEERGINLQLRTVGDGKCHLDAGRIGQVLANIIDNAMKFTARGGHILLESRVEGGDWTLRITDDGLGISEENLTRLFQPFVQVHEEGSISEPGSGLGLYICRTIMEQHGGWIKAESQGEGHGTTFTIHVPQPVLAATVPPGHQGPP